MLSSSLLISLVLSAVSVQENKWTVATETTSMTFTLDQETLLISALQCPGHPHNWLSYPIKYPLKDFIPVGIPDKSAWRFVEATINQAKDTVTFVFSMSNPTLQLRLSWRARSGMGPVEQWAELVNQSDNTITVPSIPSLWLEHLQTEGNTSTCWFKRGGSNASTQGGTCIEPITDNADIRLASNCDDGASPSPWLAIQSEKKFGLHVGWMFSGLGEVSLQGKSADVQLRVGLHSDFKTDVHKGETFLVPPAFVGCYDGDLDDGAYTLHRWIIDHVRPSFPEDTPDPTLAYNLYLDVGGSKATEKDVLNSADICHRIGFETFMPDAMWFPETGDWRWDPQRFPHGVTPIEEAVHAAGMKMALWCAWTNGGVSEDPEALSVRGKSAHPDWFSDSPGSDWNPGPFYGARVCLACQEAKEWEIKKTQWLVGHHKLDYLKHDCGPIVNACDKQGHRHSYGTDTSYWATMGYYEVQEKLRKAFPKLILENCSGGGHIKDFGALQRTHYIVTTDTLSNLPDRQSIYDSTYAFPPLVLQAYTYEFEYKVKGDDPEPFLWRSAMMGAWQIDPTRTSAWTEEQFKSAQQSARIYKDWVRPMLKDVKVHHILPRPDGVHWDGMFYWSPSLKRGTVYLFRPDAEENSRTIPLKGLTAEGKYKVWSEDGSVKTGEYTGAELMSTGVKSTLPERYTSDLVYIQEVS